MKHANQTRPTLFSSLVIAAAVSAMLTACGGGGGGGGGSAAPVSGGSTAPVQETPAPQEAPSTITNTAPTPTYTNGSESAKAFALLNAERVACGFGAVAQNTKLDATAAGHANYLLVANYQGHYQNPADSAQSYFTGNGPGDRATKAGYGYSEIYDEQTLSWGITDLTGRGEFSTRSLLNAVYHLKGMVSPAREVGISIMSSNDVGTTGTYGPRTVEQWNFAVPTGGTSQQPSGSEVLTYPCQGTAGTFYELVNETPNPVPGRDLMANPLGQGVYVRVREGQALVITSAKMSVNDALGTQVALRDPMVKSNDPNTVLSDNEAIILPDTALLPMTRYYVEIAGTNNGAAFSKSFTFTTGSSSAR